MDAKLLDNYINLANEYCRTAPLIIKALAEFEEPEAANELLKVGEFVEKACEALGRRDWNTARCFFGTGKKHLEIYNKVRKAALPGYGSFSKSVVAEYGAISQNVLDQIIKLEKKLCRA